VHELALRTAIVDPGVETILVSARTGEGVEEWRRWMLGLAERAGPPAAESVAP
jgi:hypothetical protein